jgi:hypothetical protein
MNDDLERQNELADALLRKLEQIKTLWTEIPDEGEWNALASAANRLATSLEHAQETFDSAEFPTVDDLAELAREAASLARSMKRSKKRE